MSAPQLHGMGCRLRAPDHHQGFKLSAARVSGVSIPARADQRPAFDVILNQGGMGSCVANAATRAVRQRMKAQGLGDWAPARLPVYKACLQHDHSYPSDAGTFPETVIEVLSTQGFAPEALAPYSDNPHALQRRTPDAYTAQAAKARLTGWQPIDHDRDTIRFELSIGHPIIVSMMLHESFESVGADGVVPVPTSREAEIGGHEMQLAGYDENFGILANSWDRDWGLNGYCLMPWAMILDRYATRALHSIQTVQLIA